MIPVHDAGAEDTGAVGLEPGAEQIDVFVEVRLAEAAGGAMEQDASAALLGKVEESILLVVRDGLVVGEDEKDVVAGEIFGREGVERFGVGEVDSRRAEGFADHAEAGDGIVVELVDAAEEEDLQATPVLRRDGRGPGSGTAGVDPRHERNKEERQGGTETESHG